MNDGIFPGLSLRQPPNNIQAEAAILGAILSNNRTAEHCLDLLPEHFVDATYGRLFGVAIDRINAGGRVDLISLKEHFSGEILAGALAAMVSFDIKPYVVAVQDCAARRRLIEIGEALVTQALCGEGAAAMAMEAAGRIDALSAPISQVSGVMLDVAIDRALAAIELARDRQGPAGLSTGFANLDERVGGLEPGTLTVLGGRPGQGKSALGWQIAIIAARAGLGVLAISLEMSAVELGRRALATAANVPIMAMKYGRVSISQADRIVLAQRELRSLPLRIEDAAGQTVAMIGARARAMRRKGLKLILVDHLHIVRSEDGDLKQGATWAVGRISGAMKRLAKDCDCPVLLLAQLNRGVESREDKRPGLADLRQAGDIEQDADAVGFIYRPEYYLGLNKPEQKTGELLAAYESRLGAWGEGMETIAGRAEVIWAKIRDGCPGTDLLRFDGPTTTFSEPQNDWR